MKPATDRMRAAQLGVNKTWLEPIVLVKHILAGHVDSDTLWIHATISDRKRARRSTMRPSGKNRAARGDTAASMRWASNAPSHWPVLVTPPLPFPHDPVHPINRIFFAARLSEALPKGEGGMKLAAVAQTRLTPDGVLEVPYEVLDGDRHVCVFVYGDAGTEAAEQFWGAAELLAKLGEPEPVYFAPAPLSRAAPRPQLRAWGADLLGTHDAEAPTASFAIWWATSPRDRFSGSAVAGYIGRAYEALAGIQTYVLAAILRSLGLVEEHTGRVALPEDGIAVAVTGPESRVLVLTASSETGIRFHFDPETLPVRYRDAFWKLFAEYVEGWRKSTQQEGLRLDPLADAGPLSWWRHTEAAIRQMEERGEHVQRLGVSRL
ncbi:MAG: hypothetical protein HYV63_26855 [Candidatus Schekmanbacteria bacterium]|nr:hypothetical protein [Candidatus Schekmanbacteria bacterium]